MISPDKILVCPKCKGAFIFEKNQVKCSDCLKTFKIENGIYYLLPEYSEDIKLSVEKWDEGYVKQYNSKSYLEAFEKYKVDHFENVKSQLFAERKGDCSVYLEIGCGPFFLASLIANDFDLVIGIDFCPHALKIAKEVLQLNNIQNYILIHGDILEMPIKESTVDLIYGGGVIEHFQDTLSSVKELQRVLRPNGVSFNTVPFLNIAALTYRQIWGNIPNFPVLKQLAEFVHIKLLKGKHMIFGYEFSFTRRKLLNIHKDAGFRQVKVEYFPVKMEFEFIPFVWLRTYFMKLASSSILFWPMAKVVAVK